MHIIHTIAEMQQVSAEIRNNHHTLGFVPTMGALHAGHASLIKASAERHAETVVSIFVNPTQFAQGEDFERYPRTLDEDITLAEQTGATHVFVPSAAEMYPDGYSTNITVSPLSSMFEGAIRPGHFDGVATVVAKLFAAVMPSEAFFGQKDFQQTLVVRRMTTDLNLPIAINIQPTLRQEDGLALSSRNRYLSATERQQALALYRALQSGIHCIEGGIRNRVQIEQTLMQQLTGLSVDYASAVLANTLAAPDDFASNDQIVLLLAARIGTTRLIDNEVITIPSH